MIQRKNAHLDYLNFQLIPTHPALRPYIQEYWAIQHPHLAQISRAEFIHPTGGFGLVFNLGDAFWIDDETAQGSVFLDGSNTVSRQLRFAGQVTALGVRFHPGKGYHFLNVPLHHLQNKVLLLDDMGQTTLLDIAAQMAEVTTLRAKINVLEGWLLKQLREITTESAIVPASIATLKNQHHDLSIQQLATRLYLSQRQLERIYRKEVGFTPKQYARLLRIEQARHHLKQRLADSTGHIAADLGFYDQSHFIREFSGVVGITPGQYQQRQIDRLRANEEEDI